MLYLIFLLFVLGWFLFCFIVYFKAVGFVLIKLPTMGTVIFLLILGAAFACAFGFWWFIGLSSRTQSIVLWLLLILSLLLLPSILYLLSKKKRQEVKLMADETEGKIAYFTMNLKRDPEHWPSLLGLAKIYDKQNRLEEAIEAYSSALTHMGDSPLRFKTEGQLKFLKRQLKSKRDEKTLACMHCGMNNPLGSRNCHNCQASLYRTVFHWIFASLDRRVKYALLGMALFFSLFSFWVNPIFVLFLILMWAFNIIYFFLPVRFKG